MSSGYRECRVHREIKAALIKSGLSWLISPGKKHFKLYIEGRVALVFGTSPHRDIDKIKSAIRRAQETKIGQAQRVSAS